MVIDKLVKASLNILCVLSDKNKLEFHKLLFSDMGHDVSTAYNTYSAIKLFKTYSQFGRPFDVVYVDYLLCGMNGISLARRLREIDPGVSLIMLPSSFLDKEEIRKEYESFGGFMEEPDSSYLGYKKGIDDVIHKKLESLKRYN